MAGSRAPRAGFRVEKRNGAPGSWLPVSVAQEQNLHCAAVLPEPVANAIQSPPGRRQNKQVFWPPGAHGRKLQGGPRDRVGWTTLDPMDADSAVGTPLPVHPGQSLHGAGVLREPGAPPARRGKPHYPPYPSTAPIPAQHRIEVTAGMVRAPSTPLLCTFQRAWQRLEPVSGCRAAARVQSGKICTTPRLWGRKRLRLCRQGTLQFDM